jgi:hypothetical protein
MKLAYEKLPHMVTVKRAGDFFARLEIAHCWAFSFSPLGFRNYHIWQFLIRPVGEPQVEISTNSRRTIYQPAVALCCQSHFGCDQAILSALAGSGFYTT